MQLYLSWFSDFDTSDISIFQEGPYVEDSAGEFWIWDKGMVMTLIILCMKKNLTSLKVYIACESHSD